VLDVRALLAGFERELETRGVSMRLGFPIRAIRREDGIFRVEAAGTAFRTRILVNAAGAWACEIARLARASVVPLVAYRRHLFETPALPGVPKRSPFVWHVSREFYFRPLEKGVLVSPCDRTPVPAASGADPGAGETVDPAAESSLRRKLGAVSKKLSQARFVKARSGLRTMAPDGRFVIGQDPKLRGFFWVAGLGGHGVTTSFSVGRLAADMIIGKKVDAGLKAALSPGRFGK
jgi:glycine/D-amino acid oxidase-like deaminating enzyme